MLDVIFPDKFQDKRKAWLASIPHWDEYFIQIAVATAQRANCVRGKDPVGAVIVRKDRIISTGYNGTPSGMENCLNY